MGSVKQGYNVFRRDTALDVVDVIEHVAATGLEGRDIFAHVFSDFLWCPCGQDVLGINATTPEDEVFAEGCLEVCGVHVGGADLHGIEDIYAIVHQFRNVCTAGAAGVIPDLGLGS